MNEHDKNFIKNMSPLLITAMVMFFMLVAYETKADEEVVGYTFDGHAIHKSDTEIKEIRVNDIYLRGATYNKEQNTLNLKLRNKRNVEIHFYNNCFALAFSSGLGFKSYSSLSKFNIILRKGDAIIPQSLGTWYPCTIKAIYEVIEEEENVEEN